jgi:hypothetical protein
MMIESFRLKPVLVVLPLLFVHLVVVVFVQVQRDEGDGLLVGEVILALCVANLVDHLNE